MRLAKTENVDLLNFLVHSNTRTLTRVEIPISPGSRLLLSAHTWLTHTPQLLRNYIVPVGPNTCYPSLHKTSMLITGWILKNISKEMIVGIY